MIVLVLALAVTGAFATSAILFAAGASLGMIALGYVVGGWGAVLVGGILIAVWRLFGNTPNLHGLIPTKD